MNVCMCIYIYVCIRLYMCMFMYLYLCIYVHESVFMYICIYVCIHIHTNTHTYTYSCIYTYMFMFIHWHTRIYVYMYVYICVYIYVYIRRAKQVEYCHEIATQEERASSWPIQLFVCVQLMTPMTIIESRTQIKREPECTRMKERGKKRKWANTREEGVAGCKETKRQREGFIQQVHMNMNSYYFQNTS